MAKVRTSRGAWIRAGLAALEESGPDGVRVEELARRLGVTKGGFYGHFDGRVQFLAEMLDTWEREAANAIIDEVEAAATGAWEKLTVLAASVQERTGAIGLELAIREWSRRDPAVAERTRRVDRDRVAYLHALFLEATGDDEEATIRAALTAGVWLAGHLMRYDAPGRDHNEVLGLAFERTFSVPDPPLGSRSGGS